MKRLSQLLVISAALMVAGPADVGGNGSAFHGEFRDLIIDPGVADNLGLLFSQLNTEIVLCLEGERRGPDLYITDFRMPHILLSEQGRVQAAGCKARMNSVGTWHNHPAPRRGLIASSPELLARNCYLSRTDIEDFQRRSRALISVVSCAPNVLAFWKRADVEAAPDDATLLPPPASQLVAFEPTDDDPASDLTQARRR